ncbi:hypothetical protein, partial [Candidatus Enterovibrio escicola]|uniref:hypothetical protein n=1 Tax=Candidatus Enterovibrio escicola TaxID=1927127 RepID=UPI001238392C
MAAIDCFVPTRFSLESSVIRELSLRSADNVPDDADLDQGVKDVINVLQDKLAEIHFIAAQQGIVLDPVKGNEKHENSNVVE